MDEINKIPPVTRTMVASLLAVTVPVLLKLVSPYHFILWWPMITKKWQFWRFYTTFFFGSGGIQFLFDIFMLFRNASELEIGHFHRRTADFMRAIFVMALVIVGTNYPLSNSVLFHPLLSGLTYLWSRANPHGSVSLFGFVTIPARWMPYAYLGLDLLMAGPSQAILSATGIIGGHTYWFLEHILPESNGGRGPRYLPATPAWLRRQFPDSLDPNQRGGGGQGGGGTGAWAPRGRSFGDSTGTSSSGGSAANMTGRGRSLGSSSTAGGSSWTGTVRNWMTGTGAGGGGSAATYPANSSTPPSRTTASSTGGPNREAMYRAAEARLKKMREDSIAGKNEKASALAASARSANEDSAARRRASAGAAASSGASASAGNARSATFAEMKAREEKEQQDSNKTSSASGGRVMEEGRGEDEGESGRDQTQHGEQGTSWKGKGRTLAD